MLAGPVWATARKLDGGGRSSREGRHHSANHTSAQGGIGFWADLFLVEIGPLRSRGAETPAFAHWFQREEIAGAGCGQTPGL